MVDVARPREPITAEVPAYDKEEAEKIIEDIKDIVE